ncbi:MAG: DUF4367 domain-containing protein [Clostridia bacterium]|nr:DUF4367 domain-containing protein [Clostridia bacterium]
MMKITDDLVRQALEQELDREVQDISSDERPTLSPGYRRAISRLSARQMPKKRRRTLFVTVGRRVAAFAFAILLTFSVTMSVKAIREPVTTFFTETVGEWVRTVYDTALRTRAPEIVEQAYVPEYVPDGYELIRWGHYKLSVHYIWENEDGELLMFDQSTLHGESFVRNKGATVMNLGDVQVLYYQGNSYHIYYWNTEEYEFCLSAYEVLSNEEIMKIIASVR